MTMLIAAALVFLGIHFVISGTRLRDAITRVIGEGPYLGLFSLASLATIVWVAMSYNTASASSENRVIYDFGRGVKDMAIPIIAIAFWLGGQGLFTPNPTSVRQEDAATREDTVRGVLRITRHPFLWGVVIWSAIHLLANGDLASIIFFGTFFVLALFGTYSIDAKRKRKLGPKWDAFAAKTSNVPFAAINRGQPLNIRESLGWRAWAALAIFIVVLFAHPYLFGVSPFPGT